MCAVLQSPFHSLHPNFAHAISRKFERGRFLVIGADPQKLERQFAESGRDAVVLGSSGDLPARLRQGDGAAHFEIGVWFYPLENSDDDRLAEELSRRADDIVLMPGAGVDVSQRRPQLVESFRRFGLLPDYEWDPSEVDPAAIRLRRQLNENPDTLIPAAVETAFARLNARLSGLERMLRTRVSELEAADRHIAAVEEKLFKLKEYRRELKVLKEQKQALRKSPERRIGQVLLAPYRLPEKLVKAIRKKLHPRAAKSMRSAAPTEYQKWLQQHRASASDLERMRHEALAFAFQPLISIIAPVFDTRAPWLEEAVQSVLAQVYENWELILIDDASTNPETLEVLSRQSSRDARIRLIRLEQNGGISVASNRGLAEAQGEWIGLLDHDDLLEPDALFQTAKLLQTHSDADLIYSDEDKFTEEGFAAPMLKPDWSPDFFLACNYLCHFITVRRELVLRIGGFSSQFDGSQDYDLLLRAIERTDQIHHIPRVLYHWRQSASSSSSGLRQKPGQFEAGRRAIGEHLRRKGIRGHVAIDWRTHAYWVKRELAEVKKISIIIPVRDRIGLLARCIESITTRTSYPNYEIVVVGNDSQSEEVRAYFGRSKHRLLCYEGPFNYSAINNFAVEQTESPWLLFLNHDIEVIEPDWLAFMAEHVQRPEVGAVGARLLNPDDTIAHAGIVLGVNEIAQPAFRGFPAEDPGVCRQLQIMRNYSAVSGACLLTRRDVFDEVEGFDKERLPVTFSDVDLCLKMRRAGYLIVYTPFAKLYHHESGTRGRTVEPLETEVMRQRWPEVLEHDPYYNPNLSRDRADFSLGK
jgi:GT2 family glycosyltransferase